MNTIQLTPEQHELLGQAGGSAARAVDPLANKTYVLVEERLFEQLQQHLGGDECNPEDLYSLLVDVSPGDWEDPSVYGLTLQR